MGPGWSSLTPRRMLKQRSVRFIALSWPNPSSSDKLTLHTAKFTGYQYGGRPLGLTYVKYTNQGGDEGTEGMTQDQMM